MSNTSLVDYGIFQEVSEMRAHVSPATRRVYCFSRERAVQAIIDNNFPQRPTYSRCHNCGGRASCEVCGGKGRVKTAEGYLVPPGAISGCQAVRLPESWWEASGIDAAITTGDKGDAAVRLVEGMLKTGRFPLNVRPQEVDDEDMQIKGTDILVEMTLGIQVKCDFKGGSKDLGGTGNLYIQFRECNPWQQF